MNQSQQLERDLNELDPQPSEIYRKLHHQDVQTKEKLETRMKCQRAQRHEKVVSEESLISLLQHSAFEIPNSGLSAHNLQNLGVESSLKKSVNLKSVRSLNVVLVKKPTSNLQTQFTPQRKSLSSAGSSSSLQPRGILKSNSSNRSLSSQSSQQSFDGGSMQKQVRFSKDDNSRKFLMIQNAYHEI